MRQGGRHLAHGDHALHALQLRLALLLLLFGTFLRGDVHHRTHPADVLALAINEPRGVHHGVHIGPVAVAQPGFNALGCSLARQCGLAVLPVPLQIVGVPVGVWRQAADELGGRVAHHVAHGGVHVDDAAFQVAGAHAHQQRILHRLPKRLRLLQGVGALVHALLQFHAGLAVFLQAPLAQLPVQGAQHQQAGRQACQRPGLLPRQRHHLAVGRQGEGPAKVGQGFFQRQVGTGVAGHVQLGAWLVGALHQLPRHGSRHPLRAVLLIVL